MSRPKQKAIAIRFGHPEAHRAWLECLKAAAVFMSHSQDCEWDDLVARTDELYDAFRSRSDSMMFADE